jgi:hypothetical protein
LNIAQIVKGQFNLIGKYDVKIKPSEEKDIVQMDKKNRPDMYINKWWLPKTPIEQGISKVFKNMERNYV